MKSLINLENLEGEMVQPKIVRKKNKNLWIRLITTLKISNLTVIQIKSIKLKQ